MPQPCILDCTLARDNVGKWIHIMSEKKRGEQTWLSPQAGPVQPVQWWYCPDSAYQGSQ